MLPKETQHQVSEDVYAEGNSEERQLQNFTTVLFRVTCPRCLLTHAGDNASGWNRSRGRGWRGAEGRPGTLPDFSEEWVLGVKLLQWQDCGFRGLTLDFHGQHLTVVTGEQSGEGGDLQSQETQITGEHSGKGHTSARFTSQKCDNA